MTKKRFYVTTPIYYPNANLHIGHAYSTSIADFFARYKKLNGYEVFFLTGSDEHGQKIERKALEAGLHPLKFVDPIIENFKKLWNELGINYDYFIRTTDVNHVKQVQKIFEILFQKKLIYKGEYVGKYCVNCEAYYSRKSTTCNDCQSELIDIKEESYFLKIRQHKKWIKKILLSQKELSVLPTKRVNELINGFIDVEFEDLSISRTSFKWGIPVLNDQDHIIYVWIDALSNYITALNLFDNKEKILPYWENDVEILQIIGKEIAKFHCVYWPILLKELNLRLPNVILSHGWIVTKDGKMSKSKGNVVNPFDVIAKYSKDALRWYFVHDITFLEDGIFNETLLINSFNSILNNNYGNLISRTLKLLEINNNLIVPNVELTNHQLIKELDSLIKSEIKNYFINFDQFKLNKVTKNIINILNELNKLIDKTELWNLVKNVDKKEANIILNFLIHNIWKVTLLLQPFLIEGTKKVLTIFNHNDFVFFDKLDTRFENVSLNKIDHIYKRII